MDYLLADETLIDESTRSFYSEKVIYLPSYQVNDSQRTISDRRFTREELGLPSSGFVYCCFNNNYKITPDTFQSWMRILSRVPGSVLFLYSALPEVIGNLQREASAHGVAPDRLIFGTQLPFAEYLARYQAADLFLDTHPYNAGTTGSDALWAGLPVLTVQGESFPARMAASLLQALDLPDLVTYSRSAYEDLAVEIAQNPLKLSDIRRRLQANRSRTRLFDTLLFTRTLEAVYAHAHEMAQAGLSAKDFHVQNSLDSATVVIR